MIRIMLDLETLGTKPGAAIISIGAIAFENGKFTDAFYETIDPRSAVECGLKIDADTFLWWMKQSEEARAEFAKEGKSIWQVLMDFTAWITKSPDSPELWGNGSDFDNALLAEAYRVLGYSVPWSYRQNRCYRTIRNIYPTIPFKKPSVAHNALEDAKAQASHLMEILNHTMVFGIDTAKAGAQ